jgi:hypothetical protein
MALVLTERAYMPMSEGFKMVAYEVYGDSSATDIPAIDIKLTYVKFAFLINIDEATHTVLTTNYGATLVKADAYESTKKVLLVAYGY